MIKTRSSSQEVKMNYQIDKIKYIDEIIEKIRNVGLIPKNKKVDTSLTKEPGAEHAKSEVAHFRVYGEMPFIVEVKKELTERHLCGLDAIRIVGFQISEREAEQLDNLIEKTTEDMVRPMIDHTLIENMKTGKKYPINNYFHMDKVPPLIENYFKNKITSFKYERTYKNLR
ncbi:hypothetical protein GF361_02190 [Candidatus Woesearchaeota archaeon]|nr:hypothetical protein [Candidatus Woesearchaeota archaeon]